MCSFMLLYVLCLLYVALAVLTLLHVCMLSCLCFHSSKIQTQQEHSAILVRGRNASDGSNGKINYFPKFPEAVSRGAGCAHSVRTTWKRNWIKRRSANSFFFLLNQHISEQNRRFRDRGKSLCAPLVLLYSFHIEFST